MDPNPNGKRQLPPSPPSATADLAPSLLAQRSRYGFLAIREETNLQASFCRRIVTVQFENMLRRVVREELERIPPRPPPNQNGQVRYKLVFENKVKSPIFTTDSIEGVNGEPIEIAIYDTYNQTIVSPNNSLSSARLKIVTLNAERWKNQKESWSQDEFMQSVLRERDRKGPILTGELQFRLESGKKLITNIVVKDNSVWSQGGFRLGVMVEREEERVLEGVSEPFIVKDRRVKASQKPDKLQLAHKVQCLRNIAKGRASILENNNIKTVHDFLSCYYNNQAQLRQILGIKSESDKGWRAIVEHAMECYSEFISSFSTSNCTINISPEVSMDNQNIISSPNVRQIQFAPPNNDNYDKSVPTNQRTSSVLSPSAIEEAANWVHAHCGTVFGATQETSSNLLVKNALLLGSSQPYFIGSSSSEPNPSEHNIIIQDHFGLVDVSNGERPILFSGIAAGQSQSQSSFNGLLIPTGEPCNRMEDIFATRDESTASDLFRNDSFDPSQCDALVQGFVASMLNNVNAGRPFSPCTKPKRKALIKCVTWPAAVRKRARLLV